MKKKVGFAIYGCGMIAGIHARALMETDRAELIGCADISKASAERFAAEYGVRVYVDFNALVTSPEIDAVCICTPNSTHAELAITALFHNKNVVLEKPMATNTADCERIIRAVESSGKKLTVISQLRTSPDISKAKSIIESGALGRLVLCDLYMKYYRSPEYYRGSWHGTKLMDGGGALMNQGIHGVDMLLHLVGMPIKIKSTVKTMVHEIEVEDTAIALLEFENGAMGVIEAATSVTPGNDRRIEIHGTHGTMVILENSLISLNIDGTETVSEKKCIKESGKSDPRLLGTDEHRNQLGNFVNAILYDEPLIVDAYSGSRAVRVIEEIYRQSCK